MHEKNVSRWYEAFDTHDPAILDRILSDNWRESPFEPGTVPAGREDVKDMLVKLTTTFPDFRIRIDDVIQEGNKVVVRSTITGTQAKEVRGSPSKNRGPRRQVSGRFSVARACEPRGLSAQGAEPEGRGSRCEIRRFGGARSAALVSAVVPGRTSRGGRGSWRCILGAPSRPLPGPGFRGGVKDGRDDRQWATAVWASVPGRYRIHA